jgi:predicted house-cleaning NTP pyrophosphatase (Maf/HAM1 superfamily)
MAKYKITNIDEKGKVTFQVLSGSTVVMTDTRQDLPVESKEEVDEILSKFANDVEADFVSTVTVDPELTKIVNKAQEAKISVEVAVDEPVEV